MVGEFKSFLTKSNALALAIGVIIGAAMGKVVTALTADILMPVIAVVLPKGDWRDLKFVLSTTTDAAGKVSENAIKYGDFAGAVVDFIIIAFVIFMITKFFIKETVAEAPPTKNCSFCTEAIAAAATRCKYCTATVA